MNFAGVAKKLLAQQIISLRASRHSYFFEKLKIVQKQLCKLNCSYGKVSYILKLLKKFLIAK